MKTLFIFNNKRKDDYANQLKNIFLILKKNEKCFLRAII